MKDMDYALSDHKWSKWPGSTDQRIDWSNGGTLIIFIFLGIFFYYASYLVTMQNPNTLPAMNTSMLSPQIFSIVWSVIVGLYVVGAYFTFINSDEHTKKIVYLIFFTALLLIYSWTYLMLVTQDRNWAIGAHIGLLIVSIAFLLLAWRRSTVAAFVLIWPIIWLIFALFLY